MCEQLALGSEAGIAALLVNGGEPTLEALERTLTERAVVTGLGASGASPFVRWASAISTSQPISSRLSWTKRAPFIDSIAACTGPPSGAISRRKVAEPVEVRRCLGDREPPAALVEHADVESFPAEVESKMQHDVRGPPW
jgi:hypothetical protein